MKIKRWDNWRSHRSLLRCTRSSVSCFQQHLSNVLPTEVTSFFSQDHSVRQLFDLLHNFAFPKLPPSDWVFCLSQYDKLSSFNNCLFDISGSIKRFSFPNSRAFTCRPLLDQWLCQAKEWRLGWRMFHCSLKGWYFRNEISDSLSAAPRTHEIPCASDFTITCDSLAFSDVIQWR